MTAEVEGTGGGVEMRFRMLETLREFAAERLTATDRAAHRRAHTAFMLQLAEQAEVGMIGPEQEHWLKHLAREQENLRVALAWSLEMGETEYGLQLCCALGRYWFMRGPLHEGTTWLRQLLDMAAATARDPSLPPLSVTVIANSWQIFGHLAWSQGDYTTASTALAQALTLRQSAGDAAGVTETLYHLGITAYRQGHYKAAQGRLEESLALAQARNDQAVDRGTEDRL